MRRNLLWLLGAAVLAAVVYYFSDIVAYLLIAWVLSMLGRPLMVFFQRRIRYRKWRMGPGGAAAWRAGEWAEVPGVGVEAVDTVGAGDAFLAALVQGWLAGAAPRELLERANRLGAYVAARRGAMPAHARDGGSTKD